MSKILYIDDDPAHVLLLERMLSREDFVFIKAFDAVLGIEMARDHKPDLILMDINMPGMDGFEALKIIKNDPSLSHIPVIAITANAMDSEVEKGLTVGFSDYVIKPVDRALVLEKIKTALSLKKVFSVRGKKKSYN